MNKKNKPISIVGAGALGSRIIFDLAREGYSALEVWDADTVEEKNAFNQQHTYSGIGQTKILSLKDQLKPFNIHFKGIEAMWDGQQLASIVVSAVDNMEVRRRLLEAASAQMAELFIEGRMTRSRFDLFVVDPMNLDAVDKWMQLWYPSAEATSQACSHYAETASMSAILGGMATRVIQDYLDGNRLNLNKQFIYQPSLGLGIKVARL